MNFKVLDEMEALEAQLDALYEQADAGADVQDEIDALEARFNDLDAAIWNEIED